MQKQGSELQRIDEYHTNYLGYQYPLLFSYGKYGYKPNVKHRDNNSNIDFDLEYQHSEIQHEDVLWEQATKRNRLTIINCLALRIQSKTNEPHKILRSRRLYQQFLVDKFTIMESERLRWLRKNHLKLRVGKYRNLTESNCNCDTEGLSLGKRVVLPSSYVGSRKYIYQLCFDEMEI